LLVFIPAFLVFSDELSHI